MNSCRNTMISRNPKSTGSSKMSAMIRSRIIAVLFAGVMVPATAQAVLSSSARTVASTQAVPSEASAAANVKKPLSFDCHDCGSTGEQSGNSGRTGDNVATAASVARQLGIDDVKANVMPSDKYRHVQTLQAAGHIVAMAGDGVNDAPALAQANVGIAMGTGTDIAMNSARIVLVKGDLLGIVRVRLLSQATMRNIKQNLLKVKKPRPMDVVIT
uniref:Copper-translocating P-type ATPase n=1 Tax=Candidatus Nitrotoga fabula TaxID=2182327 RepID=A0A2X0REA5_9PROT